MPSSRSRAPASAPDRARQRSPSVTSEVSLDSSSDLPEDDVPPSEPEEEAPAESSSAAATWEAMCAPSADIEGFVHEWLSDYLKRSDSSRAALLNLFHLVLQVRGFGPLGLRALFSVL